MKCPVDGETLMMSDKHGVEIDYCPKCRGVWLDRGELDKIVDRAGGGSAAPSPQAPVYQPEPSRSAEPQSYREGPRRERHDDSDDRPRGKRRESFLGDLFDF